MSGSGLLAALTLDEKLGLLAGRDLWHTVGVDRLDLPSLRLTDGPNGARGPDGNHGPTSTSFPVGVAMGATWDPDLISEIGRALAHETRSKGADVLLGPTVNIPRVPLAGRNFECFSEDPLLSGTMAAAWVEGIQSEGVAACIKHFVCNDQEQDRYRIDVHLDERALREIYLEPFRLAIEQARPWALMSSYNTVMGFPASEHPMLSTILREEWRFDGLIVSDWYGTYGPGVMTSEVDLEMPGPGRWMSADALAEAIASGDLTEDVVDRKVRHLLTLVERIGAEPGTPREERAVERPEDRELARRAASASMVLLTNDGTLPLDRAARVAVIGDLAGRTPHQGGGSSTVTPHRVVSVLEGVTRAAAGSVTWTPGPPVRKATAPIEASDLAGEGFLVEYFDNPDLAGDPVRTVSTTRPALSFFGTGDRWVDYGTCSVRMSGRYVASRAGPHAFGFGAEGRLRVTFDGVVVVDRWDTPTVDAVVEVELEVGSQVEIVVEFAALPAETTWRYVAVGCDPPVSNATIADAARAAADADAAVVVVGLTPEWESEGFDRPDLRLPAAQDELVTAVAEVQPRTVVVVTAGSPVEMPWSDEVAAVVQAWYGGQEVGHAVADVLFGEVDPGGRLPVTVPVDSRQHPGLLNYPGDAGVVTYGEGVYVGYRGFDRMGLRPRFPFGHGMSYARFAAADVFARREEQIVVELELANVGVRAGTEVVQVYARDLGAVDRRLVAFSKVALDPGGAVSVRIDIDPARLRWWDPETAGWAFPAGDVALSVAGTFGVVEVSVPV